MALKQNTWKINQWYDQSVAGNVTYTGPQGLFTWGGSPYGESGRNTRGPGSHVSSPTQVGSLTTWTSLVGYYDGFQYSATRSDGTLWAWGNNSVSGQLGQNSNVNYSSPVQIPGTDWAITYAGPKTSVYATKTDGSLWSVGANDFGQLGQNNRTHYSSPVQIGSDTTWPTTKNKFGGNDYNMAAIKTDGTLWVCGYGANGQLGQNSLIKYSSPIQIPGSWATISKPPRYFQAAINTDGELWMWGAGGGGQLGQNQNGDGHQFSSPVQVPGTTWKLVCGSSSSVSATKTDGTLWSWGSNGSGILGHNNEVSYSSPVQVGSSTDWDIPLQLGSFGGGIKTDGTLWGSGSNPAGLLGQNNRTSYSSPVQVGSGAWVEMAGSGEGGSLAALDLN